jgi:hypothetical protein
MALSNDKNPGILLEDQQHISIQTESGLLTTNGSQGSPLTATTTIIDLLIPRNCTSVRIGCSTDLLVSEDPMMATYYTIPATNAEVFPVARTDNLYIKAASGTSVVNFMFHII